MFYKMPEKSGTNGVSNYFLIFIYRLTLNVNRLKMALTLEERVDIVLLSGRQGWYVVKIPDLRHLRQRITDCCATLDPNMLRKSAQT
jgi:hypothetical protein